jgi:phosphate transport system protein
LATNIAKRVLELCQEPPLKPVIDVAAMGDRACTMLREALDAYVSGDAQAARAVIAQDEDLDERLESGFQDLVAYMLEDSTNVTRALRLSFLAKYLERIGDQATNICELVVFMAEGTVIKHPHISGDPGETPEGGGDTGRTP